MSVVRSYRLPERVYQMLEELSEQTGLSKVVLLQVAVVLLYRLYQLSGVSEMLRQVRVSEMLQQVDSEQVDSATVPQDALRSQQEAQESVQEELDESQDVLEEWRSERRGEERRKREKRKKEKKKRKHR